MESETPQSTAVVEQEPDQKEGIQPGLTDRAAAINAVEETKAKLGEFAARKQITADTSGNLLTPSEEKQELVHRQEHGGQGSNETAD
jgi:hypothetical protein